MEYLSRGKFHGLKLSGRQLIKAEVSMNPDDGFF